MGKTNVFNTSVFQEAKSKIDNEEACLLIIKDNSIIYETTGQGIVPLLDVYENNRGLLADAFVVDKIIGKAAAMIITAGKAKYAYGKITSKTGLDYLQQNKIIGDCEILADYISSRDKKGRCPVENTVLDIKDYSKGIEAIKGFINGNK